MTHDDQRLKGIGYGAWVRLCARKAGAVVDTPGFPDYRERFEQGNKRELLWVIRICAESGWRIPQWAADAFVSLFDSGRFAEFNSWSDVFGRPWGDERQQRTARNEAAAPYVFKRVIQLHKEEGAPITNELFERVGEEFGMSRPVVSKFYYTERQRFRDVFKNISPKEKELYGRRLSPEEKEIYGLS